MAFQRVSMLIYKETLANVRDRKSRSVLIVPVILQLFIFAFAATLDVKNVAIGILNRDNGEQAFELVHRFHGTRIFTKVIYLQSVSQIAPFIDNQVGIMVLSIDEQFSRNLNAGKPADVQLILDGRKSNSAQIVEGYVEDIIGQFNHDFATRAGLILQTTALVPRNWFNPNLLFMWMNIPSLCGILTLFIVTILTGLSIARERELGTFDQLLVSPLSSMEIIIGKTVPPIIFGMLEGLFIALVGIYLFRVPFTGSFLLFLLSLFIFITSIVGAGLLISTLCSTQQQTFLGTSLYTSPSILLSGFITPIENMPNWFQPFTYLVPLRYFLVIAQGIFLKAMPFQIVLQNLWPMVVLGIITFTAATIFTRKKLG
jgi:ABC-2 type transport system permease protein